MLPMIQMMMAPVMAQLEASQTATRELQAQLAQKDTQLLQTLVESGKPDPAQSNLLDKMWGSESGRMESLRATHESELRVVRENSREDIKRLEQNNKDALNRLEDSHKRELDSRERAFSGQIEAYKTSYETRIDGLKSEISRLERDLISKESEVGELRAKKDKSIADQAMELAGIQESLGNVFGNKDDGEPEKWYEKVASVVMDNPDTIKNLVGVTPPQQALPPAPQENLPPPGQPYQKEGDPEGVYMRDQTGAERRLSEAELDGLRAQHEAAVAAAEKESRKPNAQETKIAVTFIENAIRNGTDPQVFAESAKSVIPADLLRYLESEGVDSFLSDVAQLESSSPLRSQNGRNWIRKVAKYLIEGVAE
jgi:hypothetical protein